MPFDPNKPVNGSPGSSAEMRGQLNGLKDLIDALGTITGAVVDGVDTLPAGSAATVGLTLAGTTLHFAFGIPQGLEGPPFGTAVVDAVTTVPAGTPASVNVSMNGSAVHFTFNLPQGETGIQGGPGDPGIQGPPGEVSQAALDAALAPKAEKPSTVNAIPFGAPASYEPQVIQDMIDKINELRAALVGP